MYAEKQKEAGCLRAGRGDACRRDGSLDGRTGGGGQWQSDNGSGANGG